jgi:hypothetical protein
MAPDVYAAFSPHIALDFSLCLCLSWDRRRGIVLITARDVRDPRPSNFAFVFHLPKLVLSHTITQQWGPRPSHRLAPDVQSPFLDCAP